jgi:biotin synthase-like enzyme
VYFFPYSGASALWALAGDTLLQQQHIAEMIGINILVDMLMLKSEKLQYISGMAIIALTKENFPNQGLIVRGGGIPPLVRLLRASSTPHKVNVDCRAKERVNVLVTA